MDESRRTIRPITAKDYDSACGFCAEAKLQAPTPSSSQPMNCDRRFIEVSRSSGFLNRPVSSTIGQFPCGSKRLQYQLLQEFGVEKQPWPAARKAGLAVRFDTVCARIDGPNCQVKAL
jgi:hypothetical protein